MCELTRKDQRKDGQQAISQETDMISKNEFAKFIREKRKEYNELHHEQLTTRKIARLLGLNENSFPKILNRERIIAIGIILELLPGEVSEALRLYEMPELEDPRKLSGEDVDRDRMISRLLIDYSSRGSKCTIEKCDARLMEEGFLPLEIQTKNKRNGT